MATFTNQAVLSYNGITTNSNIATGEIVEVLSAAKEALSTEYEPDDTVTYVVSLVNSGTAPFTGLTLTDDLGAYTLSGGTSTVPGLRVTPLTYVPDSIRYYQNGVQQATPTVTSGTDLTVENISVPAGGNAMLVYQAKVNSFANPGTTGTITNTATIDGSEISAPLTATSAITSREAPYLTILKSVSPRQVAENGNITYTFDIQNLGNTAATAADNVQITDTFNPALSNITVTYNGAALPASSYTYNAATGEFATTAGAITVPAATYSQNSVTGAWTAVPGSAVLTVTGTIR
ncbi:MAG: hypothetical protein NC432_09195 [Roseburia sp.]|nr:hypothetical protein [Roseburia sp.]MCM1098742.1 hypothetical protein [Ruminococcus flavefaciens]